jgi:hypothetical protein
LIRHRPHRKWCLQQFLVDTGTCLPSHCLATIGDQWLRLALSNEPNWVGWSCPIHLRTETDPVSETLWDFLSSIYKTMDKVQNQPNSSVQHTPSSESFQVYFTF